MLIDIPAPMTSTEEDAFFADFEQQLAVDDGEAAAAHLRAGRPIYTAEADTPAGHVIRTWPDQRRELVRFDADGSIVLVRALAT